MVLRKITKKRYRNYIGGAAPPKDNKKDGGDSANNAKIAATVTDKNIKDFKNEDYPRGWIVHDLYLAAPVKTEKDYIKQAIVVKRKKIEKKKKEEKFSTVTGIETLKKSTGGLFSAIRKGLTEGRQNFDKFMQGAESVKRSLSGQGKYGRQFSSQIGKIKSQSRKTKEKYRKAKDKITKEKKAADEAKDTKISSFIQSNKSFEGTGISSPKDLKNKVKIAMETHIKPAILMADSVLKEIIKSGSERSKLMKKMKKIDEIISNFRDAKNILLTDSEENSLFKIYEQRGGAKSKTKKNDEKIPTRSGNKAI